MGVFSFVKAGKKVFEIVKPKIAKNLAKKRKIQDEKTQNTSEILEGLSPEGKISVRTNNPLSKFNKKIADIYDEKAKGGRVGLRKGTPNPFGKKSNIQKIQEVFGVKKAKKKEKPKKRMMAMGGGFAGRRMGYKFGSNGSSKGKVPTTPKEKSFGMLSVKAKKDNNPNITFTDKIVGAKKT